MATSAEREIQAEQLLLSLFTEEGKKNKYVLDQISSVKRYLANCLTEDDVLNRTIALGMAHVYDCGNTYY